MRGPFNPLGTTNHRTDCRFKLFSSRQCSRVLHRGGVTQFGNPSSSALDSRGCLRSRPASPCSCTHPRPDTGGVPPCPDSRQTVRGSHNVEGWIPPPPRPIPVGNILPISHNDRENPPFVRLSACRCVLPAWYFYVLSTKVAEDVFHSLPLHIGIHFVKQHFFGSGNSNADIPTKTSKS